MLRPLNIGLRGAAQLALVCGCAAIYPNPYFGTIDDVTWDPLCRDNLRRTLEG